MKRVPVFRFLSLALLPLLLGAALSHPAWADYSSSTNFIVEKQVINAGGANATSSNFNLRTSIGQVGVGLSTSTSFILKGGFLYFLGLPPAPSNLSASAASASQIDLVWTDNATNEDGFKIERKTGSGSYAQIASVGSNVTSYSDTGLSASTAYTYRVRSFNSEANSAYTSEASATTSASSAGDTGGGGGGGGGGVPETAAIFRGKAYPGSHVSLLKDAQLAATTQAGPDANFEIKLSGLSGGNYVFGVWGEDSRGLRSLTHTFSVYIAAGTTVVISGIFLPPTISVDKVQVRRGDALNIFGSSAPSASIAVFINSEEELIKQTRSDVSGIWLYKLDTLEVAFGDHTTHARASKDGDITKFSQVVKFMVGTSTVLSQPSRKCPKKADVNSDCRVNLVDFSIAAYWYKRPLNAAFKTIETEKLNGDGRIDLVDFSIMAYYWTG